MFYCLKNESNRIVHTKYYHPPVAVKNYNDMSDGQSFFNQTLKNYLSTYDSNWKIIIITIIISVSIIRWSQ